MSHPLRFESKKGRICVAWVWNREGTEKLVNGKQHSVWFVPTGMKGLPQNVLLNSVGISEKWSYHLPSIRNIRNFLSNGKHPRTPILMLFWLSSCSYPWTMVSLLNCIKSFIEQHLVLTQFLSRVTVSFYFCLRIQHSLFAPHHSQANCTSATVNKTVELNMSIVYWQWFLLLTQELNGSFSDSPTQLTTPPLPY